MTFRTNPVCSFILALCVAVPVFAEEPKQADFYTITSFAMPNEKETLETGGIELMPDGKIAVCTRRGQIWTVDGAFGDPKNAKWQVFAEYLHEPLGLAFRDGWLYAVQRPEVTRMKDEDGDGRADVFETVSDVWGVKGDYHEYNFGSHFDKDGNFYTVHCLTGSFTSQAKYRGWVFKIDTKTGKATPFAYGVRSPGGIGYNAAGDIFYTDNQGAWNGSSSLKWVKPGSFQGNPNGNIWFEYEADHSIVGNAPPHPNYEDGPGRSDAARKTVPTYIPPALVLPHGKLSKSPTGIVPDLSGGKFGPFAGQTFVGEQSLSTVIRCHLEKVNGIYQGAAFPFLRGFKSGNIGMLLTKDGVMFTGGSNRGWGAQGGHPASFERVNWTGKVPFEIHEMRAKPDGFELTFTKPIDKSTATRDSFKMDAYTYIYQKAYGSPEVDKVQPKVTVTSVADDGKSLRLKVEPLTKGHVHELRSEGLKSEDGHGLLNKLAYYTLNEIPVAE
ncbi:MAG: hypothetical protein HKN23_07430 [Verrucomicrobiales bacterium]|nr:hypothetical protein [Verrucomicrobiales bacterium]